MWRDTLDQSRKLPTFSPPPLERSLSTSSDKDICPTPDGPPCITARELSPEELKRNYSCDNVWDQKTQPLVPMDEMVGFGRHRRSKNASIEWQVEQLEKANQFMPFACELASLANGPSPAAVALYKSGWSRSNSTTSTRSEQSSQGSFFGLSALRAPSLTRSEHVIASDSPGAELIARMSPAKTRQSKSSSTSHVSPYINSYRPALARAPTSLIAQGCRKKIEQPCVFNEDGNTDSAFVSDDEDEANWRDISAPASKANEVHLQGRQLAQELPVKRGQVLHIENLISEYPRRRRSNTVKHIPPRPVLRRGESNDAKKPKLSHIKPAVALPTRKVTVKRIKPAPKKTGQDLVTTERRSSSSGESDRVYMKKSTTFIKKTPETVLHLERARENAHSTTEQQPKPQLRRDTPRNEDADFLDLDESTLLANPNADAAVTISMAETDLNSTTFAMEDGPASIPIRSGRGRSSTMIPIPKPVTAA